MMCVAQSQAIPELRGERYLGPAPTQERGSAVLPGEPLGCACHSTNRLRPKKTRRRVRVVLWATEKGVCWSADCQSRAGP